jgi:tetratricopeptide (TPR) repeat protein
MADFRVFPLQPIRTDGWFERIGEGIGSFQALCDIIGSRFFAFAMITGARITSLTVDRRNPDNTQVDFTVGGDEDVAGQEAQRLSLADFRRRLVNALITEEPAGPPPERATDIEALQRHVGVRYLLLAPLYGYSLQELEVSRRGSTVKLLHDGLEELHPLPALRARLRTHVREELDRVARASGRGTIDLARVAQAEEAAGRGDSVRVLELLGAWPAPLAIFLRTPEGQLLGADTRATIARGLGILGTACVALGDVGKGEEVLRLAVQYAGDGPAAAEIFTRLGEALLDDGRPGEAIGPLRRAANLGAMGARIWPKLAQALADRGRYVAAFAALLEARAAGIGEAALTSTYARVESRLGPALGNWRKQFEKPSAASRVQRGQV